MSNEDVKKELIAEQDAIRVEREAVMAESETAKGKFDLIQKEKVKLMKVADGITEEQKQLQTRLEAINGLAEKLKPMAEELQAAINDIKNETDP